MPVQLREPFFLHGRRSVLQRAILMTLVLTGLAMTAAWMLQVGAVLSLRMPYFAGRLYDHLSWGVVLTAIIYGPLGFWNCRPWWFSLLAMSVAVSTSYTMLHLPFGPDPNFGRDYVGVPWEVVWPLVSGGLLFRPSQSHAIAFIASLVCTPQAAKLATMIDQMLPLDSLSGPFYWHVRWATFAAWSAFFFCGMFVPWGIPFWWPPKSAAPRPERE